MIHQEVAGSKLGRSIFPLLLILLPLAVDGQALRYPATGSATGTSFTDSGSQPDRTDIPLDFPFPPGSTTMAPPTDAAADVSLNDEDQTAAEEVAGAPVRSAARVPRSSGVATGPSATSSGSIDQPDVPALSVPDPGPAVRGERAARQYRTYSPPPDRRTYSHPGAGPAGYDSTFGAGTGGAPATRGPTTSGVQQPPPPPPPPPPGQGSPGTFSPGEPGELAGFIG
jgi:hypothetical protein